MIFLSLSISMAPASGQRKSAVAESGGVVCSELEEVSAFDPEAAARADLTDNQTPVSWVEPAGVRLV